MAMVAAAVALPASPVAASTIAPTVFTDDTLPNGNCTLREAIIAANIDAAVDACAAGAGADLIQLQAGTYALTVEGDGEEAALLGDLDVTADLTIVGAGSGLSIIDGAWPSNPERILSVLGAGTDLSASSITVRDGDMGTAGPPGGGILVDVDAILTLTDSIVTENRNEDNGGGGIFSRGTVTLTHVVLSNNDSNCCGGLWNLEGTATLTDVIVSGNDASDSNDSGGVFNDGAMTMTNVAITGNRAQVYGGLGAGNPGASLAATNVTISGNSALEEGGGIGVSFGNASFNNVTITGNIADSDNNGTGGGGGLFDNIDSEGTLTMKNSIIAGNEDRSGQAPDCNQDASEAAFVSVGHNLIGTTTGCTVVTQPTDKVGVPPGLGPLADNGGFTQTHALQVGSPAIDAGGADCAPADQRGAPRAETCDMGAYELVLCLGTVVNRVGTSGADLLLGTADADGFLAQGGNDVARGFRGNDRACLGAGNDLGAGGAGKDRLSGEQGKDRLKGQGGNDRLKGGPGKDTCAGGPGKRDRAACEIEKSVP
jgi:CSLREA domain-containing protein